MMKTAFLLLQILLILLNLPIFFWFIKRLTGYYINMEEKKIPIQGGFEYRYVFQNQRDFKIDESVVILIENSRGEWLEDSISIVHGPTQRASQKPEIKPAKTPNANEENIQIIFPKGIRPYATWMVICRTKNEAPLVKSITADGKNILKRSTSTNGNSRPSSRKTWLQQNPLDLLRSFLYVAFVFSLLIFYFYCRDIQFIWQELTQFNFFFWTTLSALLIAIVYGYIAILICTPIRPSIIMGYLDEKDLESTSHWTYGDLAFS